ncbi:MAG: VWA domain-containing protein [bacterium]|nr:VWA domain-containing protein [bacterium]
MNAEQINRWRLLLGKYSDNALPFGESGSQSLKYREMDELMDFLYDREYDEERGVREIREGGSENSQLTVPSWITKIRTLFPKDTVEILEKHALDKYHLQELLTDKEVLEKLEANIDLLKSIMQMKHLMKGEVLESARRIVKKVADEIKEKLETGIKRAITGRIDHNSRSRIKTAGTIDFKRTIRKNLKNYDRVKRRLILEDIIFNNRVRRYNQWQLIICVDESGSMLDSVIHSAVMAGIFASLPMLKTHLVIFDTSVVDLTGFIDDAVRTLMSVQLGGGTDIGKALAYCLGLVENPHKTIVVLVTDLCEGGSKARMYRLASNIIEGGSKLIITTSLDAKGEPVYDKKAAEVMASLGADVAALTPEKLAKWVATIIF